MNKLFTLIALVTFVSGCSISAEEPVENPRPTPVKLSHAELEEIFFDNPLPDYEEQTLIPHGNNLIGINTNLYINVQDKQCEEVKAHLKANNIDLTMVCP